MAKLRSSSCGPLVQGMMLLALLLLPSIQAVPPIMAELGRVGNKVMEVAGKFKEAVAGVGNKEAPLVGKMTPVAAGEHPLVAKVTPVAAGEHPLTPEDLEKVVNAFLTDLGKKDGWKEFSSGAKKGIKFRKYWCKAQDLMDKLAGTTDLGRFGDVATNLSTFSYELTSEAGFDVCWSKDKVAGTRATTTLVPGSYANDDGRYYVQIRGIRVGQWPVVWTNLLNLPPPAYLSTIQPYTYIESNLYGSLRAAVDEQMKALHPGATPTSPLFTDKLCYEAAALSTPQRLPGIAIVLASNNAAMEPMELAAKWEWDTQYAMFCMGILPATTVQPVLGTMIQSGKTMTIDLTPAAIRAAGGLGTLTFTS